MKLYAMPKSGNCYKVAWMLNILKIPFDLIPTTFVDGGTKHPKYLEKNPNGQVPLLELDNGRRIAESNAIMLYLAELQQAKKVGDSNTIPLLLPPITTDDNENDGHYQRAMVYQWLFFEQYSHEPAIAVRRANIVFNRPCPTDVMQKLLDKGYNALNVMEQQLNQSKSGFIVDGNNSQSMTIADIALYAYTHIAHEGEYDMKRYPNIVQWMERIKTTPGYIDMDTILPPSSTQK